MVFWRWERFGVISGSVCWNGKVLLVTWKLVHGGQIAGTELGLLVGKERYNCSMEIGWEIAGSAGLTYCKALGS